MGVGEVAGGVDVDQGAQGRVEGAHLVFVHVADAHPVVEADDLEPVRFKFAADGVEAGLAVDGVGGLRVAVEARGDDVTVDAADTSTITADVAAPVLSVSASTGKALSVSVGLSLARNEIDSDIAAYITDVGQLSASGNIDLSADRTAIAV